MKKVLLALAFATLSEVSFAGDICDAYAQARADEVELPSIKTVDARKDKLTKVELAMVQTAILVNDPSQPHSEKSALELFRRGLNEGSLDYLQIEVNSKKYTVVQTRYFPGDNEYGAIFLYKKTSSGLETVRLLGLIGDSDVTCIR